MGVRCHYCTFFISRESAAGSLLLRHIQLFHNFVWVNFQKAPRLHQLICGVCGWTCTTTSRDFCKHINHHAAGTNSVQSRSHQHTVSAAADNEHATSLNREITTPDRPVQEENSVTDPYMELTDARDSDEDHRVNDQHEPDLRHLSDAYSTNCNGGKRRYDNDQPITSVSSEEPAAYRYIMDLYMNGTITTKTIQASVSATQTILSSTVGALQHQYAELLEVLPKDLSTAVFSKIKSLGDSLTNSQKIFHGLETEHQRRAYLQKRGLVMPKSFVVGQIPTTRGDGGQCFTPATAEYISLIDTLMIYNNRKPHIPGAQQGILQSYRDTVTFQSNDFYCTNPSALQLTLYHDDIETGNPLGSRAGVHKLTMFYIAVDGYYDGRLNSIHLALICHASDLALFGYQPILKPLLADLEELATGMTVIAKDGNEYVLHARLEHISADNLAANQLMGFNRSFSKGHFCRFCYADSDQCARMVGEDISIMRSATNLQIDVETVEVDPSFSKRTGVRARSALDNLSYFSILDGTVPDIMHDFLEGIGPKELRLVLQKLIFQKHLTLEELNDRIRTFDYGAHEKKNRPSLQISLDSIKQSATQFWCLIRFLPQLIGHKVPYDHDAWQIILLLRRIMDLVFSPTISFEATSTLAGLIADHHSLFLEVFPNDKLSAKAHWLIHYPDLIRRHGPLIHYWCMRFEGKHKLAKSVTNVSCNRMNVPLTVATRYQLKAHAEGTHDLNEKGCILKTGDVCVAGISSEYGEPVFGLVVEAEESMLTCNLYDSHFDRHYHAYRMEYLSETLIKIDSRKLKYKLPVSHVVTSQNIHQFCIRHSIV